MPRPRPAASAHAPRAGRAAGAGGSARCLLGVVVLWRGGGMEGGQRPSPLPRAVCQGGAAPNPEGLEGTVLLVPVAPRGDETPPHGSPCPQKGSQSLPEAPRESPTKWGTPQK